MGEAVEVIHVGAYPKYHVNSYLTTTWYAKGTGLKSKNTCHLCTWVFAFT
jgi:hypothetical protein